MKCMHNRSLRDTELIAKLLNIQNPTVVPDPNACDDDAVTIIDGYALCRRHFNEHIIRMEMKEGKLLVLPFINA